MLNTFAKSKNVWDIDDFTDGYRPSEVCATNPYVTAAHYVDMNGYASFTYDTQQMDANLIRPHGRFQDMIRQPCMHRLISPPARGMATNLLEACSLKQQRAVFHLAVDPVLADHLRCEFMNDADVLYHYASFHDGGANDVAEHGRASCIGTMFTEIGDDQVRSSWAYRCDAWYHDHCRVEKEDRSRITFVSIASKAFGTVPGVGKVHPAGCRGVGQPQ
ncbi:hypothetical protein JKP88DRAFT_251678 [Tribonema minus]|uniref:Uncharacterized protein n=1 Tax=Tribonema minus TaxID=303371 RepID=A0A835ZCR2_9STRA|nr:hypothetical protein JKP88DRAFT_251678 [Tribonema minus]